MSNRLGSPKNLCLMVCFEPPNPHDSYYMDQQLTLCGNEYDNMKTNGTILIKHINCARCLVCMDALLANEKCDVKQGFLLLRGKHTPDSINALIKEVLGGK